MSLILRNICLFRYIRGTLVASKVVGSFFDLSKTLSHPDRSYRKFKDTGKPYFHLKILGDVFLCMYAYQNFTTILGNINVYPNIVKPIH